MDQTDSQAGPRVKALVDEVAECCAPKIIAVRWEVTGEVIIIVDRKNALFLMASRIF